MRDASLVCEGQAAAAAFVSVCQAPEKPAGGGRLASRGSRRRGVRPAAGKAPHREVEAHGRLCHR
eukprot:2832426-Alexandrium_andersonii.AAC.1